MVRVNHIDTFETRLEKHQRKLGERVKFWSVDAEFPDKRSRIRAKEDAYRFLRWLRCQARSGEESTWSSELSQTYADIMSRRAPNKNQETWDNIVYFANWSDKRLPFPQGNPVENVVITI